MSAQPELIADYACHTGENPLWHPLEKRLYWIDIPAGRIFRYDPASGQHEQCHTEPEPIGGFTVQADGGLLLFMARGAIKIWCNGETQTVIDELPDERTTRFNDVIADPMGRVFCGTMPAKEHAARLYRLDPDGTIIKLLDGIGISNGMGFTPDNSQMYYADTPNRVIYLFDYNRTTGALTNQRPFVHVPDGEGMPDGLTVDTDGYVWSARWGGSCVVRYAPDASEERRISFPVKNVSSVAFGGVDYRDIYVTTAGGTNKAQDGELAGGLFRLRFADVQGRPENLSTVTLVE
jgi:D-xylonolactonase